MKPQRGRGGIDGGLQTNGRFAFGNGGCGAPSARSSDAATEQRRNDALAKLEAFGKEAERERERHGTKEK